MCGSQWGRGWIEEISKILGREYFTPSQKFQSNSVGLVTLRQKAPKCRLQICIYNFKNCALTILVTCKSRCAGQWTNCLEPSVTLCSAVDISKCTCLLPVECRWLCRRWLNSALHCSLFFEISNDTLQNNVNPLLFLRTFVALEVKVLCYMLCSCTTLTTFRKHLKSHLFQSSFPAA